MFLDGAEENEDVVNVDEENLFNMLQRTSFTRAWNTAGALVRPNGMTRYS
jgi:hypothetical protein